MNIIIVAIILFVDYDFSFFVVSFERRRKSVKICDNTSTMKYQENAVEIYFENACDVTHRSYTIPDCRQNPPPSKPQKILVQDLRKLT